MTELLINALELPDDIRKRLLEIDKNIDIANYDNKATNGYVFFGKNKITAVEVVIKFYYWGGLDKYHAEPVSLTKIDSENVLKVFDAGYAGKEWAYFVTPMCSGGDLDTLVLGGNSDIRQAVGLTENILHGLAHLHAARFVHRDLKPANVFLENDIAVIGDFGSLKKVLDGEETVPASSHAILYRPPEAIGKGGNFGFRSDIYQVGLVLFQLLGGSLPYDPYAWLSKKQLAQAGEIVDEVEKCIFIDRCIEERISKGKIANSKDLPAWVSKPLRTIVKRATSVDPGKRFQNVADFLAALNNATPSIYPWRLEEGALYLDGATAFKITEHDGVLRVAKRRGAAWRNDNSFPKDATLETIIAQIEDR